MCVAMARRPRGGGGGAEERWRPAEGGGRSFVILGVRRCHVRVCRALLTPSFACLSAIAVDPPTSTRRMMAPVPTQTRRRRRGSSLPLLSLPLSALPSALAMGDARIVSSTSTLFRPYANPGDGDDGKDDRTFDPADLSATCVEPLRAADADGDGVVQNSEYPAFVAALSEGDFGAGESYVDLPFVLKVNFVYLSCLCGDPAGGAGSFGGGCCGGPDAGIAVDAAAPGSADGMYWRTVCGETQGAIDYAREEAGITRGPTGSPTETPSASPTKGPTSEPTANPTVAPTSPPSKGPTDEPTASPTEEPSAAPSKGPTGGPTSSPTVSSTNKPTENPTSPPSAHPTEGPTRSPTTPGPSASPNAAPVTAAPTKGPTPAPVTDSPTPAPITGSPTGQPTSRPVTASPIVGTTAPVTSAPATSSLIVGTASPATEAPVTASPVAGTAAPVTSAPATSSPITEAPVTASPIVGTAAPAAPTNPPAVVDPLAPSAAPIVTPAIVATGKPTVTQAPSAMPSVSLRPSGGDPLVVVPLPSGTPPSAPGPNPPVPAPGGVRAPGADEGAEDESSDTLSAGQVVGIALASAFVAGSAMYLYARRRKPDGADDPELQNVVNKDLDDLEEGHGGAAAAAGGGPGGARAGSGDDGATGSAASTSLSGSDGAGAAGAVAAGSAAARSGSAAPYHDPDRDAGYIPRPADATSPHFLPSSSPESKLLVTGVPPSPLRSSPNKESDSSSAGESGWSSSAGASSLDAGSFDMQTDDGLLPGSPERMLAAVGAANVATVAADSVQREAKPRFLPVDSRDVESSVSSSASSGGGPGRALSPIMIHSGSLAASSESGPPPGKITRDDLNAAIEAGDWAMVGATAALLADSSLCSDHSLSGSERSDSLAEESKVSAVTSESSVTGDDRARELDRMVEQGDWEGVVLAAAQFEGDRRGQEETVFSSSGASEGSAERETRIKDVRAEVERLVRRVVPDEIDNIDEMMVQFDGCEEELIETLCTMQERSVTQRARAAVQKTAKLEAKARASISKSEESMSASGSLSSGSSLHRPPAATGLLPLGRSHSGSTSSGPEYYGHDSSISSDYDRRSNRSIDSSVSDLGMTSDNSTDHSSSGRVRSTADSTSLELAIERGDWRAVGEAAVMMGEGSSGVIPNDSQLESLSSSLSDSDGRVERVHHLDALIAKGDWAGIVAAAGRYQAIDDRGPGGGVPTEEEREALAQADMWHTIADQSARPDGSAEAKGAQDAADWAIKRSLERRMRNEEKGADYGLGMKKPRITDDESV
ncbi:hypothetical protein ACHAWF_017698 [Thalassiosira exigua]